MKFSQMKPPSKYLTKEDVDPKRLVTIRRFALETLEMRNKTEEKWVLYFNEFEKGMILNPTNKKLLLMACGIHEDEDNSVAIGKKIVIFNDPSVQDLSGELVGGIRIRKAELRPVPKELLPPAREPGSDNGFLDDDSISF